MARFDRNAGRGRVGVIIALVVCGYGGYAAYKYFPMRIAYYDIKEHTAETLKFAGTKNLDPEGIQREIYEKVKELELPVKRDEINVMNNGDKWRVTFAYKQDLKIPGYSKTMKYTVDESWTRY